MQKWIEPVEFSVKVAGFEDVTDVCVKKWEEKEAREQSMLSIQKRMSVVKGLVSGRLRLSSKTPRTSFSIYTCRAPQHLKSHRGSACQISKSESTSRRMSGKSSRYEWWNITRNSNCSDNDASQRSGGAKGGDDHATPPPGYLGRGERDACYRYSRDLRAGQCIVRGVYTWLNGWIGD